MGVKSIGIDYIFKEGVIMPQMQLPIFPPGLNHITSQVGYEKRDGKVWYFLGQLPLYSHEEDDVEAFRFISSQLVMNGHAKQSEIVRAFGVTSISVKRSVKRYRERGMKRFFEKEKGGRSPHVLTPNVSAKAQRLLDRGYPTSQVAASLGIKADTIRKAIQQGRLQKKR